MKKLLLALCLLVTIVSTSPYIVSASSDLSVEQSGGSSEYSNGPIIPDQS